MRDRVAWKVLKLVNQIEAEQAATRAQTRQILARIDRIEVMIPMLIRNR